MSQYTGSVPETLRSADWRDEAVCATPAYRDVDFFPTPGDQQGIADAKAVCAACPVWGDCLTNALRQEGGSRPAYRHGVRGGFTETERFAAYRRATQSRRRARQAAAQ